MKFTKSIVAFWLIPIWLQKIYLFMETTGPSQKTKEQS